MCIAEEQELSYSTSEAPAMQPLVAESVVLSNDGEPVASAQPDAASPPMSPRSHASDDEGNPSDEPIDTRPAYSRVAGICFNSLSLSLFNRRLSMVSFFSRSIFYRSFLSAGSFVDGRAHERTLFGFLF